MIQDEKNSHNFDKYQELMDDFSTKDLIISNIYNASKLVTNDKLKVYLNKLL